MVSILFDLLSSRKIRTALSLIGVEKISLKYAVKEVQFCADFKTLLLSKRGKIIYRKKYFKDFTKRRFFGKKSLGNYRRKSYAPF
jgi:hypothetical protein